MWIAVTLTALALACHAAPTASKARNNSIVLWHGLGDSFDGEGMQAIAARLAKERNAFVHVVALADEASKDRKASFFGKPRDQVDAVAATLADIPQLADGYDAIGFSQGGQLLRDLAQRYPSPPVRKLLTFGSQHMGVSRLPPCREGDLLCRGAEWALRAGVWSAYAQSHVVPAAYFRNQADIASYLRNSGWLREVNNERWGDVQVGGSEDYLETDDGEGADHSPRDESLADNLASLERFVMFRFSAEATVVPPESAWFTLPNATAELPEPIPYARLPLYADDYVGLRRLDEQGRVHFGVCEGAHMQIDEACERDMIAQLDGRDTPSGDDMPLPNKPRLAHKLATGPALLVQAA